MKTKAFLISILFTFGSCVLSANDGKYVEVMKKNIKLIYEARETPKIQEVVNSFIRIAGVEKEKWEPLYYIAYGNIMMANVETDGAKKDAFLDVALEYVSKAKELRPNESELFTLEGFIFMMRVTVDPQSRGAVHAPVAMKAYGKALELNPSNPRALALMAQMEFGTARFFNSPIDSACATNAKAVRAFKDARPENELSPVWGSKIPEALVGQCKQE